MFQAVGPGSAAMDARSWTVKHAQSNCKSPHGSQAPNVRAALASLEAAAMGHRAVQLVLIEGNVEGGLILCLQT